MSIPNSYDEEQKEFFSEVFSLMGEYGHHRLMYQRLPQGVSLRKAQVPANGIVIDFEQLFRVRLIKGHRTVEGLDGYIKDLREL